VRAGNGPLVGTKLRRFRYGSSSSRFRRPAHRWRPSP